MLQRDKAPLVFEHESGTVASERSSDMLADTIALVRRQYAIIAFVLLLAFCAAGVYLVTAPANYTATATLLIDTRKNQLFQPAVGHRRDSLRFRYGLHGRGSQVQILRSETIALAVIKDFRLTDSPEFIGAGGLFSSLLGGVADLLGARSPKSDFERLRDAAETFADRLSVRRIGLTYILEISFRSLSPEQSAVIANAVAEAYITDLLDAKYKATRRASLWLQDRIRELREQASAAERSVVEFKAKNNIVESGGRLMNEQELAEINSQLVLTRAQVAEAKARLDRIQAVISADSPDASVNATVADTFNKPGRHQAALAVP